MTRSPTLAAAQPPFDAVIFDLDGVVTNTAVIHQRAWKDVFEAIINDPRCPSDADRSPFTQDDYFTTVDGKPRESGLIDLLASRGIPLGLGQVTDAVGDWTAYGLGALKNRAYLERLAADGVQAYPGTSRLLKTMQDEGVPAAIVTSSRNAMPVLSAAGLADAFQVVVDGTLALQLGLPGKPAPDVFLEAAHRLGVSPERAVVIEDSVAGVLAARRGGFGRVVGIDRLKARRTLEEAGAHVVLNDVSQLDLGVVLGDPWQLVYRGMNSDHEGHREALTTLGNGYLGVRGAAPEGGEFSYPGMYLAGVFNRLEKQVGGSRVLEEHLVNAPDCLSLDIRVDSGDWWSAGGLQVISELRTLDLARAVLERQVVLETAAGRHLRVEQQRFVSMAECHLLASETRVTPLGWNGAITFRTGVNTGTRNTNLPDPNGGARVHLLDCTADDDDDGQAVTETLVEAETTQSRIRIAVAFRAAVDGETTRGTTGRTGQHHFRLYESTLMDGEPTVLTKVVAVVTSRDRAISSPRTEAQSILARSGRNFEALLASHGAAWQRLLRPFRVDLDAPTQVRLVLNLHLFHLLQTLTPHTMELDAGVPARGLHGEGYRGQIFWDELFVLPVLTLRTPDVARALLNYRWRRLPAARQAAVDQGRSGAMFPWQSGSDGTEETPRWLYNHRSGRWMADNSHLQRHVGLAVAFNAWQYYEATVDRAWLFSKGADLIVGVCRYFASLVEYEAATDRHHLRGLAGPDEYHTRRPGSDHPGVDDNAYTNVMASWVFVRAAALHRTFVGHELDELEVRLGINADEVARWERMGRSMYVPFEADGTISQFDGYGDLVELDWARYRETYGNIERLDLILEAEDDTVDRYKLAKQADVLMLPYLLGHGGLITQLAHLGYTLTREQLARTIDYYLARTAHGSTLSRVVHASVLASTDPNRAWDSFREALDADLDDTQDGTTKSGIHLGAMAGTIDVVQRSFAGLRLNGDHLVFEPSMPAGLGAVAFSISYRGHQLQINLSPGRLDISSAPGDATPIWIQVNAQTKPLAAGDLKSFSL
ncbi:beta-phosphoglucomutase family hydrolase [Arthrobacter sp. TB 23]|uniref:beta-phosphoglucomutase family hydrolase n=1 Tax=Arthrobacter sp. TB 23 TaxID=494419 RepID=UPI00035C6BEB|nr:beta-phosphoglucomutase family hydrolase [Arthrobacter sp. TB 23]